jgi:VanZ family protein
LTIAIMTILAYFPFDWNPPHTISNDVTRTAQGDLRFGEHNAARSSGTPEWLIAAQSAERLTIDLEARPQSTQHQPPTSIMMLASDFWHTSFAIGQDGTGLVLWMRRTGSSDNGDPPFTVPDVFRPNHWTIVQIGVVGARLTVVVDGRVRVRESLPSDTLRTWSGGRVALGDEVHGGNGWRGEIRRAQVTTVGDSINYVQPGALLVPPSYFYFPDHITPFPPPAAIEWFILVLHFLSFVSVGFLLMWISRPAFRVRSATIMAFGLAVLLALGKFLFDGRHTSVADLVAQLVGGLVGAMLGHWALRKARQSPAVSRDGPDTLAAQVET